MILEILGAVKGQRKTSPGKESINEAYTIETRSFKKIQTYINISVMYFILSAALLPNKHGRKELHQETI